MYFYQTILYSEIFTRLNELIYAKKIEKTIDSIYFNVIGIFVHLEQVELTFDSVSRSE